MAGSILKGCCEDVFLEAPLSPLGAWGVCRARLQLPNEMGQQTAAPHFLLSFYQLCSGTPAQLRKERFGVMCVNYAGETGKERERNRPAVEVVVQGQGRWMSYSSAASCSYCNRGAFSPLPGNSHGQLFFQADSFPALAINLPHDTKRRIRVSKLV